MKIGPNLNMGLGAVETRLNFFSLNVKEARALTLATDDAGINLHADWFRYIFRQSLKSELVCEFSPSCLFAVRHAVCSYVRIMHWLNLQIIVARHFAYAACVFACRRCSIFFRNLSHFYVGSMFLMTRLHLARSCASSTDGFPPSTRS